MKKILSAVVVLMMLLSLSTAAFAAEDTFVPSIGTKDAPEVVIAQLIEEGKDPEEITEHHLLITPVARAVEEPRIPETAKDLLLYVYDALNTGAMELPADKLEAAGLIPEEAVIRDLVDISWICEEVSPTHAEKLLQENVQLVVTFKMKGLEAGDTICVMNYTNDVWEPINKVVNNGDGTITCTFDHLCPVAFVVGPDGQPDTGLTVGNDLMIWAFVLVVSAVALVVVVTKNRKVNG